MVAAGAVSNRQVCIRIFSLSIAATVWIWRMRKLSKPASTRKPIAVDLFAGCGGLTLGLQKAGFEVVGAIEIDELAVRTYKANHPNVAVEKIDIQRLSAIGLMRKLKLRPGELDLLAGCPPCQGFSTLRTCNGARRNRDQRNGLLWEMLRFTKAFRPKAIMMENVPKLSGHRSFKDFCDGLQKLGYKFTFAVKDASRYGVPQRRRRLVLLAGLGFELEFAPESRSKRTVRTAIGNLPRPGKSRDPLQNLPENRTSKVKKLIRDIPTNGGSRRDLPKSRQLNCHTKTDGFSDVYGRMAWDDVSPTITSGCFNPSKGRFLHPRQNRAITMREAALLQTFPRSYVFDVSAGKEAIALLVGNALPPEFVRRHASSIFTVLSSRSKVNG